MATSAGMTRHTRTRPGRIARRAGLAILAASLIVVGLQVRHVLVVGVGHKARTLCSGVFVSGRPLADVERELQVDDLAALRYVGVTMDRERGSLKASAFGLVTREALHRPGLGCALVLDGLTPPALPAGSIVPPANRSDRLDSGTRGRLPELEAVLARAFTDPDPAHPRRTAAVVVVQHGRVLAERYAPGITPQTPLIGWSMSKSLMNALVGILVRDGRLEVSAPAPVPEWQRPGDPRAAITLDHLLRMSSGLRFEEAMASPRSDVMQMLFGVGDSGKFAADRPLTFTPGTMWTYSSATSNLLARIVRHVLADDEAYLTFPRRALFEPLRMHSAILETDAAGTFIGSSYAYASARDWARFGLLYLGDGRRDGTRILPEGWIEYTSKPAPADPSGSYGAHFWLQVPDEYGGANRQLPFPALHAAGHEGQFVTIVPSHDAVIVRLGRTRYPEAWDHASFVREVLAALDDGRRAGRRPARPDVARYLEADLNAHEEP